MALDFMAIISNGSYPTPTPTASQRASFAVSLGLLGSVPEGELSTSLPSIIFNIGRAGINFAIGIFKIGR